MSQTKTPPMVHKANEGDRMEKADRLQTDSRLTGRFRHDAPVVFLVLMLICFFLIFVKTEVMKQQPRIPRGKGINCRKTFLIFSTRHPSRTEHFHTVTSL